MSDNCKANGVPNPNNCFDSPNDYLQRAASACEAGDLVLGMYLYLAAYEKAVVDPNIPDGMALSGLHEAWHLACDLKERSMAEYVFEKLEPFLMPDEISEYAAELQNLTLDHLAEFGFSREELEDMAEIISQDIMNSDGPVVKVESIALPRIPTPSKPKSEPEKDVDEGCQDNSVSEAISENEQVVNNSPSSEIDAQDVSSSEEEKFEPTTAAKKRGAANHMGLGVADVEGFDPYKMLDTSSVGTSYYDSTNSGSGAYTFSRDKDRMAEPKEIQEKSTLPEKAESEVVASSTKSAISDQKSEKSTSSNLSKSSKLAKAEANEAMPSMPPTQKVTESPFNYRNLVGYDEAISVMRDFGIGMERDQAFQNFVSMLNSRHGLSRMPALDTVLFRAPVIEDATRFLEATIGEIGLPVLRMSMEENVQGMPMLCISALGNSRPRMNHAQNRFEGPGILVIDDLDMWMMPSMPEGIEGLGGLMMANISRGAREAVNLIRSAVEDPDVYVFATATLTGEVDPFFYELLEPMTVIEISNPTERERQDIWVEIMDHHPSMRCLDAVELARLSNHLARYDIYMAAREALEEAYKLGLIQRTFVPVKPQNVYDKLAACHALESDEYIAIEDEIVKEFRNDLNHLEDLIDGSTN